MSVHQLGPVLQTSSIYTYIYIYIVNVKGWELYFSHLIYIYIHKCKTIGNCTLDIQYIYINVKGLRIVLHMSSVYVNINVCDIEQMRDSQNLRERG